MRAKFLPEVSAALSIFAASTTGAFAQATYSVTDLGQINTSYALSINNSGQVAVTENAVSIISPLGKYINDSGQILPGTSLLYGGGTVTPVVGIDGTGINNSGQVVGTLTEPESAGGDGFNHAILYSGGTVTDFGDGSAIAINDSGQVVGFNSVLRGIANLAFNFTSGGALAPNQSWATAINNNGQVVGQYDNSSYHAFLYSGGTETDLGTLPGTASSEAHGINDSGQIVGYCFNNVNGAGVAAFIYKNGAMTDLNSLIPVNSDWDLINAEGINNNGQIVGYGTNPSGQTVAFLLTPVPEPSNVALSVAGAAVLVVFWRIKHRVTIL
jgi:probable HAF family extracellular repeat protein